jgi:UDP-N-acetylmuramyl pentapeptide phosphotransferase/UDP-N-acetylglucosamine-1-phosphate transferase
MRRVPLHRWLAALPGLLIVFGVPFANRVHRLVLGLPFLLLWIVGCVVLTSLTMALVGWLDDRYAGRANREPDDAHPTGHDR